METSGKDGKGRQAGCGHADFPQQPKGSAKDALRGSFVSSSEFESFAFEGASLVAHMVKSLPAEREIPGSGRSPGEGNGNPLQYSFLERVDIWKTELHSEYSEKQIPTPFRCR